MYSKALWGRVSFIYIVSRILENELTYFIITLQKIRFCNTGVLWVL